MNKGYFRLYLKMRLGNNIIGRASPVFKYTDVYEWLEARYDLFRFQLEHIRMGYSVVETWADEAHCWISGTAKF